VEPQARGFVHDEDLVVLVENLEGLGVGDERDGARRPAEDRTHARCAESQRVADLRVGGASDVGDGSVARGSDAART
jgi:hypothetical protein